jgi:hypothetical protein
MRRSLRFILAILPAVAILSPSLYAAIANVKLNSSPASPQLLGTTVHLSASASDSDPGPLTYKWEVELPGASNFSVMRDFDLEKTFTWTPNYVEGTYRLRLTARDYLAGTSAQQVVAFVAKPLVTGTQPVAATTANPLVALFSAPSCPAGSTMSVVFQQQGSAAQSTTDARPCHGGTMNFYIAGMAASQTYVMTYQVDTGGKVKPGPPVSFTTGAIPTSLHFPTLSVPVKPGPQTDTAEPVALTGFADPPDFPIATDLNASVIWYYAQSVQLARPVPSGTMLALANGQGTGTGVWGPNFTRGEVVREYDLAGNTVRETNCDRVYEQLTALGLTDPLSGFNHDAVRLDNGETMVIGYVQKIFPAGTQGSASPIDIIGALIVVLDDNFQVLGYWNSFDHACSGSNCLDIDRPGDIVCTKNGQGGCPQKLLSTPANDWLHANSLEYLPSDGDLLVSLRDQDWIVKIDYNNGTGTNGILWRLGLDGDFTLSGTLGEPYPWFSGQHDAGFINDGEQTLMVYDNGDTRHAQQGGDSRGQVWNIDQTSLVATLQVNFDLGAYSQSLGSAQLLQDGDYMFMSGNILFGNGTIEVQNTEFTPGGTDVYQFQGVSTSIAYRGWRLPDLYHCTLDGSSGPE